MMEKPPDQPETKGQAGVTPLLLDVKAVAGVLSVGTRMIYSMMSSGELGPLPIRLGRRTLWRYDELAAWVHAGCPRRELWLKMAQDQGFGHQHGQRF
ncbi:MAG: helix-turn-helix domain-containing protein [Planctomycetota bacterium]|jgi:predicted DNA-binding transcriptional regulator AlpA|nr:helix-turn-helix domain-containing protein [Planctomycetota bacterium]